MVAVLSTVGDEHALSDNITPTINTVQTDDNLISDMRNDLLESNSSDYIDDPGNR